MLKYKGAWALGFFILGIVPGGGPSNIYSKLLNGDLSLSITMTTLSTAASIGEFTVGKVERERFRRQSLCASYYYRLLHLANWYESLMSIEYFMKCKVMMVAMLHPLQISMILLHGKVVFFYNIYYYFLYCKSCLPCYANAVCVRLRVVLFI